MAGQPGSSIGSAPTTGPFLPGNTGTAPIGGVPNTGGGIGVKPPAGGTRPGVGGIPVPGGGAGGTSTLPRPGTPVTPPRIVTPPPTVMPPQVVTGTPTLPPGTRLGTPGVLPTRVAPSKLPKR